MSKEGRKHRGYWKRLIAAALCASITVTTVFPDNGVAFAASLEDTVATEETRAANEYAEATEENWAVSETASADDEAVDAIEIEPEEVMEGSDSMDFTGGEGGVSLVDEADPNIEPYATADEFGEIVADAKEEAAIVAEDISKRDQYQKEFKLEDNTRLLVVYPEAVHYEKNGEWEDIDNTLIASQSMNGKSVLTNQANCSGEADITIRLWEGLLMQTMLFQVLVEICENIVLLHTALTILLICVIYQGTGLNG